MLEERVNLERLEKMLSHEKHGPTVKQLIYRALEAVEKIKGARA